MQFTKTIDEIECIEEPVQIFGKQTQRIVLRFKAKGFMHYQVRMMTGALL